MKKNFLRCGSIANLIALALACSWLTAPTPAFANGDLDRQYALETVGFLRSWDNVDGLFVDYVAGAYKDYFSHSSRFALQDLSLADPILLRSKIAYNKLAEDPMILGQVARVTRSQSLIRTKIYKEGPRYRFVIDWLKAPHMDLMVNESFTLEEPRGGMAFSQEDIKNIVHTALDRMVAKIPFVANVTGRDNGQVTVNIGENAGLKKGDMLVIATIDEVKRHPLLKTIVDWRLTKVGRVEVEQVDRLIAFGKVVDEEQGRQITRYQKVVQVLQEDARANPNNVIIEKDTNTQLAETNQTFGWGSAGLWLGGFSRQYSSLGGSINKNGSAFITGAKAEGQLWFTRDWFAELGFGYGFFSYSQTDATTGAPLSISSASGNVTTSRIDFGYNYLMSGNFFGPRGWAKVGYHSFSYSLPDSQVDYLTATSWKALFLGIGGVLPIRDQFGAELSFDIGVLRSASETSVLSGDTAGTSDVEFFIGGYYRIKPRMNLRLGVDVISQGADFVNNPTTGNSASVSHKSVTFAPTLVYYF